MDGIYVETLNVAALKKYWFPAPGIQHNKYASRDILQIPLESSVIVRILDDASHKVAFLHALLDDIIILQLVQLVVEKDGSVYECWSQLFS